MHDIHLMSYNVNGGIQFTAYRTNIGPDGFNFVLWQ